MLRRAIVREWEGREVHIYAVGDTHDGTCHAAEKEQSRLAQTIADDPLAIRLDSIDARLQGIEKHFDALDLTVLSHDKSISQFAIFCDEQVKPALARVQDMRVELAKFGVAGGGFGAAIAASLAIGKAMGWW